MSSDLEKLKNRERAAAYRRANPEKVRETRRRAREKALQDPDKIIQLRGYQLVYREKNRQELIAKQRYRKFGITHAEYAELHQRQKGLCAICFKPETATRNGKVKSLAVDHCHESGKIRGLLCYECNTGIGKLHEDENILMAAVKYLKEHSDK